MCGFLSGLSILLCWSMCLFLCRCHIVLAMIALQYCRDQGEISPYALRKFIDKSTCKMCINKGIHIYLTCVNRDLQNEDLFRMKIQGKLSTFVLGFSKVWTVLKKYEWTKRTWCNANRWSGETQQGLSVSIPLSLWAAFLPSGCRAGSSLEWGVLWPIVKQGRSGNFFLWLAFT